MQAADLEARAKTLYGAWLSAMVLDGVGMALHHKLAPMLGGSINLPHAPTHTVVLPYPVAYNHSHAPEAVVVLARALGCAVDDVAGTIQHLVCTHGGPVALKDLGLPREALDAAFRSDPAGLR